MWEHFIFLGRFYISNSISLVLLGVSKFLSPWTVFLVLFTVVCKCIDLKFIISYFLLILSCRSVFPFSFQISFTVDLPLFSWSVWPDVCQFYLSFQITSLALLIFPSDVALWLLRFYFSLSLFSTLTVFVFLLFSSQHSGLNA